MAEHRRRCSHQNRTKTGARSFDDCVQLASAFLLKVVGKLNDQNSILRNQTDQRDQSHLAVDVQTGKSQERERERSSYGQWY